jgi:lactoylglutathione lyase
VPRAVVACCYPIPSILSYNPPLLDCAAPQCRDGHHLIEEDSMTAFVSENQPGVHFKPEPITQRYVLNHSMLRVKDPKLSLDFYTQVMGMRLLRKLDFPEWTFSLYFLAMVPEGEEVPEEVGERQRYTFTRQSVLELTHNWGTEKEPEVHYHSGNEEPQGFGHICFSVPDLYAACKRFDGFGIEFAKRPDVGLKDVAFIKDPDGYWIEILQAELLTRLGRS